MVAKVLVANRGEIALRVVRACRELGVASVVVHSTEDRDSMAVRLADERVQIGPGPSSKSYLNMAAIIEAALRTSADAVHPGYGFLSEDADFADACIANGLVFIGPTPEVIAALGDKPSARRAMAAADVPVLPGSDGPVGRLTDALKAAEPIGYPLIVKAAAGGGGRGMQVVRDSTELAWQVGQLQATAQKLFGDGRVYLERYLPTARHIEVQLIADGHGNVVHLGERDCSVQRRYQKIIEETPAPGLPAGVSEQICAAALRGIESVGYQGAATVEFLLDPSGDFYFMEVNCRVQVEHPVTEMVTGVDVVAEQIRVASGLPLSVRQPDVVASGVAIECRINAEDPARDFAPTPGLLDRFELPGGPFVRVDSHGYTGYRIPAFYDSLLAKLIVWAPDRDQAIARMRRALVELRVEGQGIHTNAAFLDDVLASEAFRSGRHDTGLLADLLADKAA